MRVKPALYYAAVAGAVAAALVVTLRLWERRMEVSFAYDGDPLFLAVLTKGIVQDGFLHLRHLGMPFGVDVADWGLGLPLDFAVLRTLGTAFGEPGAALNAWWMISVVLTGVFATFAFRVLDLRPGLAFGLGYLYALLPYAFFRNVVHIVLVYHFIPLVALLAIRAAEGRPERLTGGTRVAVLLGCAGQGLGYIYYSFFSCLLLGVGGALGWLRTRRLATLKLPAAGALLVVVATVAGLAPSLLYWREHGRIRELEYKRVSESDMYGLKIRHLLIPIPDHPLGPWRALATAAAAADTGDNENTTARLGTVGSVGFLGLLVYAVGSAAGLVRREHGRLAAAAALSLVCVLVAEVGGLGSLFNALVAPDIRAYNRIVVFIAFFSLLAAGLGLERLEARAVLGIRPAVLRSGVLAVLLVAVFDQASTAGLRQRQASDARRFDADREFVRRVESRLSPGAMVFQLPHTPSPVDPVRTRMLPYDHGHAYLHSGSLRWSWGAWAGRHGNWQADVQKLGPRELLRTLVLAGFQGVWIDRFGYEPPAGRRTAAAPLPPSPEATVLRVAGEPAETSLDGRYVFVSLEGVRRQLLAAVGAEGWAREQERALRPPLVPRYREGFGDEEGDAVHVLRSCGREGRVVVPNPLDREREVLLTGRLLAPGRGAQDVEISSPQFRDVVTATADGRDYRRTVFLPAGRRLQIRFSCRGGPDAGPDAPSCFRLEDFRIVDLSPGAGRAGPTPPAPDEEG